MLLEMSLTQMREEGGQRGRGRGKKGEKGEEGRTGFHCVVGVFHLGHEGEEHEVALRRVVNTIGWETTLTEEEEHDMTTKQNRLTA